MPPVGFDLTALPKATLTGTLAFDTNAQPIATAHVVLSLPSTIAGLAALQYETDLATESKTSTPEFTMSIPSELLGRPGTVRVLPSAPDDATHAPLIFGVTLAAALTLPVSPKSLTVSGRLLSALGDPLVDLQARAFQDGDLVSDVVSTTMDGFTLTVPSDTTATSLAVEVQPKSGDTPGPHFWAKPFALTTNVDLGDVELPAYGQPTMFQFPFGGPTNADPKVVGALVRARTVLADDATGTTDYLRDGLTDMTGLATLSLLPGTTTALRLYDIAVVPPADSVYAMQCFEGFGLVAGIVQPAQTLARRPVLVGSVTDANGTPVPGVAIQATRLAGLRATACDAYASAPQTSGKTEADGSFRLHLDAGSYTLDFDPPVGTPYPRLTETAVVVSDAETQHVVSLPPAAFIDVVVRDVAGSPLPQAGVRFYGPACAEASACPGTPPVLKAQARADANGFFRAVVPMQ
jgi:hypothetical protein